LGTEFGLITAARRMQTTKQGFEMYMLGRIVKIEE